VGAGEEELTPSAPELARLETRLRRAMGRAIEGFSMLEPGDRVLCAVSGGKDSYTLHHLLDEQRRRSPVKFELVAVNIDQGHPGYPGHLLTDYMRAAGHDFRMIHEDTYSIVKEKVPEGKTTCSLCSRLRRGILYRVADELGCNKIALGHHRDDVITTLMLNLVFAGQLNATPPKLVADDGRHVVLRPLVFAAEADIAAYASAKAFPILPCNLCGSQDGMERKVVSQLLADLDARSPGARASMLAALANVRPSHLLDAALWRQLGLEVATERDEGVAVLPSDRLLRPS